MIKNLPKKAILTNITNPILLTGYYQKNLENSSYNFRTKTG